MTRHASPSMWFPQTQVQAIHEDLCEKDAEAQRQQELISALQCFANSDTPPMLPPITKRKKVATKKPTKKVNKPKTTHPRKRKPPPKTFGSLAIAKYGQETTPVQKSITDFIESSLRFQQPAERVASFMASKLVDSYDYAVALGQLRLRFPQLHPQYKRSLRSITSRMLHVDEPAVSQVMAHVEQEDSSHPINQLFEADVNSLSLWARSAQAPHLEREDILWLYDLEDDEVDEDNECASDYSGELSGGGFVVLTQEAEIDEVSNSEDEPEPLQFDPGFKPLLSFTLPMATSTQVPESLEESVRDPSHQAEYSENAKYHKTLQSSPRRVQVPSSQTMVLVPESSNLDRLVEDSEIDRAFIDSDDDVFLTAHDKWNDNWIDPRSQPQIQVPSSSPLDGVCTDGPVSMSTQVPAPRTIYAIGFPSGQWRKGDYVFTSRKCHRDNEDEIASDTEDLMEVVITGRL